MTVYDQLSTGPPSQTGQPNQTPFDQSNQTTFDQPNLIKFDDQSRPCLINLRSRLVIQVNLANKRVSVSCSRCTGNAGLCGLPLSKYCPGDKELEGLPIASENMDDKEGTNDLQRWFYIGGATGFITRFWVYVNMMVFIAKLRRVSHP